MRRTRRQRILLAASLCVGAHAVCGRAQTPAPAWQGVLENRTATHLTKATVRLDAGDEHAAAATDASGSFRFLSLLPKTYALSVELNGQVYRSAAVVKIPPQAATVTLTLEPDGSLVVAPQQEKAAAAGEQLNSKAVSEIPLNKRDFSQLLLLAAGTAADSSGASNFTQQFAINGQRDDGSIAVPEGLHAWGAPAELRVGPRA